LRKSKFLILGCVLVLLLTSFNNRSTHSLDNENYAACSVTKEGGYYDCGGPCDNIYLWENYQYVDAVGRLRIGKKYYVKKWIRKENDYGNVKDVFRDNFGNVYCQWKQVSHKQVWDCYSWEGPYVQ